VTQGKRSNHTNGPVRGGARRRTTIRVTSSPKAHPPTTPRPAVAQASPKELALERDAAQSRMMKRLASTLRHDLNSPLQAAIWAFDLIERGLVSHPDAAQRQKIGTSVELGRRELTRLQKAVRLFVSCAAPLDDRSENFDVCDVLGEVEHLLTAEATLHDVQLVFAETDEPVTVNGVRHEVQQALLLLALEAMDIAGAGGRIEVRPTLRDAGVDVNLVHTLNGSHAQEGPLEELTHRVVEAVAGSHGGMVKRSDGTERREVTFSLARR